MSLNFRTAKSGERPLGIAALAGSFLVLVLVAPAPAQQTWQHTYGGALDDRGYSVEQTSDGGYVVAGYASSFGAGGRDVYLIKTDAAGETLWTHTYGGVNDDYCGGVQQTSDGGYIVAGTTLSFGAGGGDIYLIRTNALGDTLWTRTYGDTFSDVGWQARQTSDSGFVVAGGWGSGQSNITACLIKTNASGDAQWTRTYGGAGIAVAYSVQQTSDGGFVVAGTSSGQFYLIRTDAAGDTLWTRYYRVHHPATGMYVQQTSDSGFVVAGYEEDVSGGPEAILVKYNAAGDTIWTHIYDTGGDEIYWVRQTSDGGYIAAGWTWTSCYDAYLIKTSASGDTLRTRTYGGALEDFARSVQPTSDGGYIVAGYTASFGAGSYDVFLIKTDSLGYVGIEEKPALGVMSGAEFAVSAEPSLFRVRTVLSCRLPAGTRSASLEIRDVAGRLVRVFAAPAEAGSKFRVTWDGVDHQGQRIPAGCYFCTLRAGSATAQGRVVLAR